MKATAIVFAAILVFSASSASSQAVQGQLQVYGDETGVDCIIQDVPGLVTVHVYYFDYYSDNGIAAIQFAAPLPGCWTGAVWLGDGSPWPVHLGDSQLNDPHGWSFSFQGCVTPPVYIGSIMYFAQGLAQSCCPYPVVKADDFHPEFPMPIGVDCSVLNPSVIGVEAGTSYINGDHTCPCIWPVPVQEKTWGAVKSLYR